MPILRLLVLLASASGLGCQTSRLPGPVAPELAAPVLVFESLPPIDDPIRLDAPNAALRFLALQASHPLSREEIGAVDLHLASFRMHDWDFEAEMDPVSYGAFLAGQQDFITAIADASRMDRYDMQPAAAGYYGVPDREDPRNSMVRWMNDVRRLLRDDAIRAWVEDDHKVAIGRVETMVRVARQIPRSTHAYTLDNLLSVSWAAGAIDLLEAMAADPEASRSDRDRIREVLGLLSGDDPLGHFENMRRVIASYDVLVSSELEDPNGGAALWRLVAEVHAVNVAIEEVMRPMRDAVSATSGADGSGEVEAPSRKDGWTAMVESILDQLDGLTAADLRRSYRTANPQVAKALAELNKDDPDPEVFSDISDALETDGTGIPDILHLSFLNTYVRTHRQFLRQRNELQRILTE